MYFFSEKNYLISTCNIWLLKYFFIKGFHKTETFQLQCFIFNDLALMKRKVSKNHDNCTVLIFTEKLDALLFNFIQMHLWYLFDASSIIYFWQRYLFNVATTEQLYILRNAVDIFRIYENVCVSHKRTFPLSPLLWSVWF